MKYMFRAGVKHKVKQTKQKKTNTHFSTWSLLR